MKFIIRRTSGKDVEGSEKELVWYYDYRGFPSLEVMKKDTTRKWIPKWFREGRNHLSIENPIPDAFGVNAAGVVREIEIERQFIEIDDIIKWIEELGENVLVSPPRKDFPKYVDDNLWELEITDDFLC